MNRFKIMNFFTVFVFCLLLSSCENNKDFVAMPEGSGLSGENDRIAYFFALAHNFKTR